MANFTIYKKVLMRGEKGDTGGGGIDTTVPQSGIIAYKGDEIPEGYILYSEVPDGVLTHITATYTQTATITDASSLDDLRPDLVVKAYYYDDETGITSDITVTDYTLSGTLEVGTSTITASYKGFSDSFDVTVESSIIQLYNWDFTQSLTDNIQGLTATLKNTTFTQGVGIVFDGANDIAYLGTGLMNYGYTLEVDIASANLSTGGSPPIVGNKNGAGFFWQSGNNIWIAKVEGGAVPSYTVTSNNANIFSGKTLKMVVIDRNHMDVYSNDTLVYRGGAISIGSGVLWGLGALGSNGTTAWGNSFFNMTITGVRIYETPQGGITNE